MQHGTFIVQWPHLVKDLGQNWQDGLQVGARWDELKRDKVLQSHVSPQVTQVMMRVVPETSTLQK